MKVFVASVIFQVLWFLAVVGRDDWQWILLASVATLWLFLVKRLGHKVKPLLVFSFVGICLDSVNQLFGVLDFDSTILPLWMVLLWLLFSWYLVFLSSFLNRISAYLVPFLFMVSGTFSYFVAISFAAATHQYSVVITAVILATEWFLLGALAKRVIRYV